MVNTGINSPGLDDDKEDAIYLDSASDVHTSWDRSKVSDHTECSGSIKGINGQKLQVLGRGTVDLRVLLDDDDVRVRSCSPTHGMCQR